MNKPAHIDRRAAIRQMSAITAFVASATVQPGFADEPVKRSGLGIVMYDCNLRRKWMKKQDPSVNLFDPLTFVQHCRSLGAGGAQVALGSLSRRDCDNLRQFADEHDLYIETIVKPPRDRDDLFRFDAEMKAARDAGAKAARTVIIPGRRYEYFNSYADFKAAAKLGHAMVERALPVVEKYEVPLAIENHKDERIDDRVALFERINSPMVGACVDTGNSFSLLDDVYGSIEGLAPFACSVHFKDQSLSEYDDGFLLGDIPLGQGSFDLKRIVEIIRAAKPNLQFSLEVITRDALKVPCLTKEYWQSVAEPTGADLARTLQFVRRNSTKAISVTSLPLIDQVKLEDINIASSLNYAQRELGL
ncbi:MAG: xylose isomerase [Rhodopirellula sp.]|nr:xylose isomerase [Rhodopirellula sp.]MCR9207546.1 sugar phosphate isomerase/epimerase [bacterium]